MDDLIVPIIEQSIIPPGGVKIARGRFRGRVKTPGCQRVTAIQRRVCGFVPLTDGARWTERTAFVSALLNHVKLDGRSLWCADLCCWPAEIYHGEETGGSVELG